MDYKDYYGTLGVPKDADDQTIKSAYRRLARQFHPDVNASSDKEAATEKFKEINEAYTVLSDPVKRRKYDDFGARYDQFQRPYGRPSSTGTSAGQAGPTTSRPHSTGPTPGAAGSRQQSRPHTSTRTIDPEEMERIFRSFGWGSSSSGASGRQSTSDFSDFFEALFGGLWTTAGGQVVHSRDVELEAQVTLEEVLHGTTRTLSYADGRKVEVSIPRGVDTGAKLRVRGLGERGLLGARGDLYLNILVLPHAVFTRQGDDLRTQVAVDYDTAQRSGQVMVATLDKPVLLHIPAGTQTGQTFRLRGLGLPNLATPSRRGDLYAVVTVLPKAEPQPEAAPRSAPRPKSKPARRRSRRWPGFRQAGSVALMAVGLLALVGQILIGSAGAWLPLAALAVVLLLQAVIVRSGLAALGGLVALILGGTLAIQTGLAATELARQAWPVLPVALGFLLFPRHPMPHKRPRSKHSGRR